MHKLIIALKSEKSRNLPSGFKEVMISRTTGWSYWEVVSQPFWFIERLLLYMRAENAVEQIRAKQLEMKSRSRSRK